MKMSQIEILKKAISGLDVRPDEEVQFHAINEVWDQTLRAKSYRRSDIGKDHDGVTAAYAVTMRGQFYPLSVEEDWSDGSGRSGHVAAGTVGEQLARAYPGRIAWVVVYSRYYWGNQDEAWTDIYVGPGTVTRYLRWKIMSAARELCGLIDEIEPL